MSPDEIRSRAARLVAARAELAHALHEWDEVAKATRQIIRNNARTTGRGGGIPEAYSQPGGVTLDGDILRVGEISYCGEGRYSQVEVAKTEMPSFFRVPIEFLSLDSDEVASRVKAEHDHRETLKARRKEERLFRREEVAKAHRRTVYERLSAEFGGPFREPEQEDQN
jgi:hypothetical protein